MGNPANNNNNNNNNHFILTPPCFLPIGVLHRLSSSPFSGGTSFSQSLLLYPLPAIPALFRQDTTYWKTDDRTTSFCTNVIRNTMHCPDLCQLLHYTAFACTVFPHTCNTERKMTEWKTHDRTKSFCTNVIRNTMHCPDLCTFACTVCPHTCNTERKTERDREREREMRD